MLETGSFLIHKQMKSLLFRNLQSGWEDWGKIQAAYKALEGSTLERVWKFNMPQN